MFHAGGSPNEFGSNGRRLEAIEREDAGEVGKLTDNDGEQVAGKKDQLLGKLQERYGYTREQAERDYDDWDRANKTASKVA